MSQGSGGGAWAEFRRNWPVLAGATLGLGVGGAALPFYTAGLFIGHFEREFGWTRTELSFISLGTTLWLAAIAPFLGATIDRLGVRIPAVIGFSVLAGVFWASSFYTGSIAVYILLHILSTTLTPGTTPIGLTRPVNAAFDKMRGLALGVAIGGIGVAAAFAPRLVAAVIETEGWRVAFQRLAMVVAIGGPIAILLLSLRPDAVRGSPKGKAEAGDAPAIKPWRDPVFLRLIACFLLTALAVGGFVLHFVPLLTDRGLSLTEAAKIQGVLGIAVLVGRLGVGVVVDHVFAPWVAAVLLTTTAAGLALLAGGGTEYAAIAAFSVGFTMGAEVDLIAYMTARYFGMANYGRSYGVVYGAFIVGTGVSPYIIAEIQARSGSYVPALWMSSGLLVAAASLFAFAPKFPKRTESEDPTPALQAAQADEAREAV